MKIIVTGATGWLGQEILRQSNAHPKITEIVALSRKELADEFQKDEYKKITLVKVEEFGTYSDDVLEKLKGAEGCIWTIGTTPSKIRKFNIGPEELRKINVEWPINAAKAFSSKLGLLGGNKFRFLHTSGFMVPDPGNEGQSMWVMEDYRRLRFETDKALLDMAKTGAMETVIVKPALITDGEPIIARLFMGTMSVTQKAAAACMIDSVVNGGRKDILYNSDMKTIGDEALKALKQDS